MRTVATAEWSLEQSHAASSGPWPAHGARPACAVAGKGIEGLWQGTLQGMPLVVQVLEEMSGWIRARAIAKR